MLSGNGDQHTIYYTYRVIFPACAVGKELEKIRIEKMVRMPKRSWCEYEALVLTPILCF